MKRAMWLAFAIVLAPVVVTAQTAGPSSASLLLLNGKIFTGDEAQPFVEAVAITGNKITAIGTTEEIRKLVRTGTSVINLRGQTAIPGINDAHVHPGGGVPAFRVNIGSDPSINELKVAIAAAIDETPAELFIVATVGPTIINNPNITRATLDEIGPNRKILFMAFTGHGLIMSTNAMQSLGIPLNAPDPPGGFFGRDANGSINGRAFEYAQFAIERRFFDTISDADLVGTIIGFGDELVRFGITSIQAMPLVSENRFISAWNKSNVPVRLRVMELALSLNDPITPGTRGVKWILDGTPIERGAALRTAEYPDGTKGRLNFPDIKPLIDYALTQQRGQVLVHATGDATVAQVLDHLEARGAPLSRPRIEHGDGLLRDLFARAVRLGVVVVQNPAHFQFVNAYPAPGFMPAKTLLDAKIPLAFGSDGPLNPYLGIMNAVDRPDDAEEITREQAVIAYTSGSAFAEFAEAQKGKILPGFLADIAVLSQDIFRVRLSSLPDTRSVLTIIDGKVVHSEL